MCNACQSDDLILLACAFNSKWQAVLKNNLVSGAAASSGLPVLGVSYSSCVKNSESHTDPQIRTVMETSLISPWEYLLCLLKVSKTFIYC